MSWPLIGFSAAGRAGRLLLSVEAGNAEGLPHPETLEVLRGVPLLRTERNGWIEVSTDGKKLWVEVERK